MTDPALLRRIDALIAVIAAWLVLSLVVAGFALMVVDVVVGLLAVATVVLVTLVGAFSYLQAGAADAEAGDDA